MPSTAMATFQAVHLSGGIPESSLPDVPDAPVLTVISKALARALFRSPAFALKAVTGYLGEVESSDVGLDICCGTGAVMEILRPCCRERVVGIDISRGMLEVAGHRASAARGRASLEFVQGDALNMGFKDKF